MPATRPYPGLTAHSVRPSRRKHERGRRRGGVVAGARQVDAACGRRLQVELVHHRAAVRADVQREEVAPVRRGQPRERLAPDRARLVRVLQRLRLEPAAADVDEPNLVAARAEVPDQEEVVAVQGVELPLLAGKRDRLPGRARDDRDVRLASRRIEGDRSRAVLGDAGEAVLDTRQRDGVELRAASRVVPDEVLAVLVDELVSAGDPGGQHPTRGAGLQVDDGDRFVRGGPEAEQRAVGEGELARSAVERRARGGPRCTRQQQGGGADEDERQLLHGGNTHQGPDQVPAPYGPHEHLPS